MQKIKGTLVILTLNEIEGLKRIFHLIPINEIDEVFAVDGGSTDGTLDFYKEKGIKFIIQNIKGRGEAFRISFREAKNDKVIFFSPDGNENPEDILKIFGYLDDGEDMVIASRFMKGARCDEDDKRIKIRKFGNKTFTKIANILFKGKLTDSINGFRGIKKEAFEKINPDAHHFGIEFQISIRALKNKMKIKEIPTIENERIGGESTARSFKVGYQFIGLLIKEFF
ncbi:MAG: glycosyltransferase family 2 protein, partial [Nanoarchaeota archaeon]